MSGCIDHCYCEQITVSSRPHLKCCNCGHKRLDSSREGIGQSSVRKMPSSEVAWEQPRRPEVGRGGGDSE